MSNYPKSLVDIKALKNMCDSLSKEIGDLQSTGNTLIFLEKEQTVTTITNRVAIGLADINYTSDRIMVYKNNTFLYNSIDYTIDTTTNEIVKKEGNWGENGLADYFYFVVMKNVSASAPVYDGALIKDGSVAENKLTPTLINKINNSSPTGVYAVTGGTSTSYTATLNPIPEMYTEGMYFIINPHVTCGQSPTLNINGLGALSIVKNDGSSLIVGDIKMSNPLLLVLINNRFQICSTVTTTGGTSCTTFVYQQSTPQTEWTITHNLNKFPSVAIVDSTGRQVTSTVQYIDINVIKVSFSSEFSGKAYLN